MGVDWRARRERGITTMMIEVRAADFEADLDRLHAIRFAVFVAEQGVPPELEIDERDPFCRHYLARVGGRDAGTARIDLEQGGRIGRLAVLAEHRRYGVGRALMQACHAAALGEGLAEVWCHAQVAAVPFYRALGYAATGKPFEEAGIEHVTMRRRLRAYA